MFKIFIVIAVFTMFNPLLCRGQHINEAFEGIVRVETETGRGTGFIVASSEGTFEVWTNAHCTGTVGTEVTVKTEAGTTSEKPHKGIVAWRRYGGGNDCAKLIVQGDYDGGCFLVSSVPSGSRIHSTGGHPLGGRAYGLTIEPASRFDFGEVTAYRPHSIPGQSGSPVVNSSGQVIGVVTLRLGEGKDAVGGMLPICQWTGQCKTVSKSSGFGKFKPLPNAIVKAPDDHCGE